MRPGMQRLVIVFGLLILAASVLLPPPAGLTAASWVALALLAVMALWWFTEALPVTATSLLPFVVLPLTGAAPLAAVAASYMSPIIFLVLGGALLALAMEKSGLHRRVAVAIVAGSGTDPRRLVLAFMVATAFISMWVSNTATALIMIPIAVALVAGILPAIDRRSPSQAAFARVLVLGIAYSASIGGLGTLVGSPTNAVAVGLIDKGLGIKISFLDWMSFGIPLVAVSIPLAWWLLTRVACRFELPALDRAAVLASVGRSGRWSSAERRLLPLLLLTVVAWVTLPALKTLPGLKALDDSIVAIVAALALFVIAAGDGSRSRLLDWSDTARAPWDVMILFGGGLALADAITQTGLGAWIGTQLAALQGWPVWLIVVTITLLVIAVTEFASNVAAAASVMPVIAGIAGTLQIDPLWLVMPAALAASWGFMMPAGTPPNAIAYATGAVRVPQMIRAGFWIDLLGMLAIPAAVLAGVWLMRAG